MSVLGALQSVKKHVESMWIDRCTVKQFQEVTDPVTHITDFSETVVCENEPCKLSHESFPVTGEGIAPGRVLTVKLFLSPALSIPAGAIIEVTTHTGRFEVFKASGVPAVFTNHQEINLEAKDDKA